MTFQLPFSCYSSLKFWFGRWVHPLKQHRGQSGYLQGKAGICETATFSSIVTVNGVLRCWAYFHPGITCCSQSQLLFVAQSIYLDLYSIWISSQNMDYANHSLKPKLWLELPNVLAHCNLQQFPLLWSFHLLSTLFLWDGSCNYGFSAQASHWNIFSTNSFHISPCPWFAAGLQTTICCLGGCFLHTSRWLLKEEEETLWYPPVLLTSVQLGWERYF